MSKFVGLMLVLAVLVSGGCASTGSGMTYHYRNGQYVQPGNTVVVYEDPRDQVMLRRQDAYERDQAHDRAMDWARLDEQRRRDEDRAAERAAREQTRQLQTISREAREWAEFRHDVRVENRQLESQPIVIERPSRPRPIGPTTRPHVETRSRSVSTPSVSRRTPPAPSRSVERAPSRSADAAHLPALPKQHTPPPPGPRKSSSDRVVRGPQR